MAAMCGSGGTCSPDAEPLLFRLRRKECADPTKTNIVDAKTWKPMVRVSYAELEQDFGFPYYLYHRVDLHSGLKDLALDSTSGRNKTNLHLSSEVVEIEYNSGTLTMKDGTRVVKDLLIVADGVHVSTFAVAGVRFR